MANFANITPVQNSRNTAFTVSPAGGDLNHTSPYEDATFSGMDDGSYNFPLISSIPSGNGHFGNGNSQSFPPCSWTMEENLDDAGLPFTSINNMEESTFLPY